MLRIGLDVRLAVRSRRGIGNYVASLVQNYASMTFSEDVKLFLYSDIPDIEGVLPKAPWIKYRVLKPKNYFIWEQCSLLMAAHQDKLDVMHFPSNTVPFIKLPKVSYVCTVHDVMFLKGKHEIEPTKSFYQMLGRMYRRLFVPRKLRDLDKILTISEYSKQDILKHLKKIVPEKISVTYLSNSVSIDVAIDSAKAFSFPDKYLLHLGGVDPRKNTERVIRVYWDHLRPKYPDLKLVVTGLGSAETEQLKKKYGSSVLFLGFVSEALLTELYRKATVFLYPSLYEGFGLPIVDAMRNLCPVITSNCTAMPEIAGDAATLVDPNDDMSLVDGIVQLIDNEDLRKEREIKGAEQSQKFSWKKTAAQTFSYYRTS